MLIKKFLSQYYHRHMSSVFWNHSMKKLLKHCNLFPFLDRFKFGCKQVRCGLDIGFAFTIFVYEILYHIWIHIQIIWHENLLSISNKKFDRYWHNTKEGIEVCGELGKEQYNKIISDRNVGFTSYWIIHQLLSQMKDLIWEN